MDARNNLKSGIADDDRHPSNAPSAEVACEAYERFGWLLDGSQQT
jgi:hypothetical protein